MLKGKTSDTRNQHDDAARFARSDRCAPGHACHHPAAARRRRDHPGQGHDDRVRELHRRTAYAVGLQARSAGGGYRLNRSTRATAARQRRAPGADAGGSRRARFYRGVGQTGTIAIGSEPGLESQPEQAMARGDQAGCMGLVRRTGILTITANRTPRPDFELPSKDAEIFLARSDRRLDQRHPATRPCLVPGGNCFRYYTEFIDKNAINGRADRRAARAVLDRVQRRQTAIMNEVIGSRAAGAFSTMRKSSPTRTTSRRSDRHVGAGAADLSTVLMYGRSMDLNAYLTPATRRPVNTIEESSRSSNNATRIAGIKYGQARSSPCHSSTPATAARDTLRFNPTAQGPPGDQGGIDAVLAGRGRIPDPRTTRRGTVPDRTRGAAAPAKGGYPRSRSRTRFQAPTAQGSTRSRSASRHRPGVSEPG